MKKVITALLNKNVNEKLKEYKEINIVMNDIQYQDGIIEALEINMEIDYIILSELLPGEYNLIELINKIKNIKNDIKIIIILEKENKEIENYLLTKGNINIFYNNEIKIKEIVDLIINKNKEENIELEIKKIKEIIMNKKDNNEILENNILINENKKEDENKIIISEEDTKKIEEELEKEFGRKNIFVENKLIKKFMELFYKEKKEINSKLIIISGISGVGKSVFTINLAKALKNINKKILIIDFDFIDNSLKILFGIKDKRKINIKKENNNNNYINDDFFNLNQNYNLEDLTTKINSNIFLISNINLLFQDKKIEYLKLLKIIKDFKLNYDFILIDSDFNNEYFYILSEECEKIIFLTESNILQIKKSKNILNYYINELKIEKEKINILFNKVKNDSINFNIIKDIYRNYNVIGKINFIKNCNLLINQNMKSIFIENKIKNQYKNIAKRLLQNKNIKKYYLNKINQLNC